MKKILFSIFAVLLIVGAVNIPASAMNLTAGASSWMVWWDSYDSSAEMQNPFFMAGPVISASFNKQLSLSSVVLAGKTDVKMDDGMGGTVKTDVVRVDSDTALNYKISKYFKLYGGIKIMHYDISMPSAFGGGEWMLTSFGPGAGVTLTYPLGKNFFLLGSFSAMYVAGKNRGSQGDGSWENFIGQNTTLSVAYYISGINTAISLGGRYQSFAGDSEDFEEWDHFYGMTLAAVYSFSI